MVVFWKEDSGRQLRVVTPENEGGDEASSPSPPRLTFFDDPDVPVSPPNTSPAPRGPPGPPDSPGRPPGFPPQLLFIVLLQGRCEKEEEGGRGGLRCGVLWCVELFCAVCLFVCLSASASRCLLCSPVLSRAVPCRPVPVPVPVRLLVLCITVTFRLSEIEEVRGLSCGALDPEFDAEEDAAREKCSQSDL